MAEKRRKKAAPKSKEELRREQRLEMERKKHRKKVLLLLALVLVAVVAAVVLSLTVFFHVSTIEVNAEKSQYTAEQIRTASGVETGDNLFLMKKDKVAQRVGEALPFTGTITVERSLPNKVRITVEDSSIAAAVRYNDKYIVLNEDNKVLAKVSSISKLNALLEQQEKKSGKSTAKSTSKAGSSSTTATSTTTTSATSVAAEGIGEDTELSTTNARDIRGGEDLSTASDKVTIILGVKVKEAQVGKPLVASNEKVFTTYNNIMKALRDHHVEDITSADLTKVTDIRLVYQQRITILLGSATGLDRKAALCAKVLEEQNKVSLEQKGNIDLSIEGKAYFSEGGATTRTTTTTTTTVTVPTEPVTEAVTDVATSETTVVPDVSGATDPATGLTTTTESDLVNTGG